MYFLWKPTDPMGIFPIMSGELGIEKGKHRACKSLKRFDLRECKAKASLTCHKIFTLKSFLLHAFSSRKCIYIFIILNRLFPMQLVISEEHNLTVSQAFS